MIREESHRKACRKVFNRLKFEKPIKVPANRILPLTRKHTPLSPQQAPKGEAKTHDGTICTEKPIKLRGAHATLA